MNRELAGVPLAALVDRGEHDELFKLGEVIEGAVDRCAVEHQLRRKDDSLVWCRTVMALVRDGEGDPNYGIGMLEDITNRKYVEEELMQRAVHDPLTGRRTAGCSRTDWRTPSPAWQGDGTAAWPSSSSTSTGSKR
jgi:PAS domain